MKQKDPDKVRLFKNSYKNTLSLKTREHDNLRKEFYGTQTKSGPTYLKIPMTSFQDQQLKLKINQPARAWSMAQPMTPTTPPPQGC